MGYRRFNRLDWELIEACFSDQHMGRCREMIEWAYLVDVLYDFHIDWRWNNNSEALPSKLITYDRFASIAKTHQIGSCWSLGAEITELGSNRFESYNSSKFKAPIIIIWCLFCHRAKRLAHRESLSKHMPSVKPSKMGRTFLKEKEKA